MDEAQFQKPGKGMGQEFELIRIPQNIIRIK